MKMRQEPTDLKLGSIQNGLGEFTFHIETYDHPFLTWEHDGEIKIAANVDSELMCEIGALLFEETISVDKSAKNLLNPLVAKLRDSKIDPAVRFSAATSHEVLQLLPQKST